MTFSTNWINVPHDANWFVTCIRGDSLSSEKRIVFIDLLLELRTLAPVSYAHCLNGKLIGCWKCIMTMVKCVWDVKESLVIMYGKQKMAHTLWLSHWCVIRHLPVNLTLALHPARLIKEWGCVDLSMHASKRSLGPLWIWRLCSFSLAFSSHASWAKLKIIFISESHSYQN